MELLETSPTARALLALELIQSHPGVTADRLGARLGVTERAARRYVEILREASIPINSARGPYGGYSVGRGVRLPPLMFNATEALGLVMAVLDGRHDATDSADPVASALGKIIRALPSGIARQAESVRQSTQATPDRRAAHPDPATTAVLVQACESHNLVELGYKTADGNEWVSAVEPWAVIVRHARWYLLCKRVSSQARRTYRIDRVQSLRVLDELFAPPDDLDPVAMLEEQFGMGWEIPVEVVLDMPLERALHWLPRSLGHFSAIDDEHCRLVGTTSDPYFYVEQLAPLPVDFHVVGSPELKEALGVVGRRMVAAAAESAAG